MKELYVPSGNEITRKNLIEISSLLSGGVAERVWPDDDYIFKAKLLDNVIISNATSMLFHKFEL